MRNFDVLIVGAGHGGAQTAVALRQARFDGTIAIAGDEPDLPYERPPLSKDYLAGDKKFERLLIQPPTFWEERNVTMLLGKRIVAVDSDTHCVTAANGETIGYGRLVWATGGSPRQLGCEGSALEGVYTIRARADVDCIREKMAGLSRVVVIGGGYVGLEVAAVLAKFGKRVVLLEAQDRVLARVAGESLSRFYEAQHRAHGVDVQLGVTVERIQGKNEAIAVLLEGGEAIAADLVIVGIGIMPAVEPLIAAGAKGGNGVEVDPQCRTTLPDIFAIGDCALHNNRFAGGLPIRLESVQNANDQATVAARTIAGLVARYDAVPWFWSNQYDLNLRTIGLSVGHDACVVRGDPDGRSFSVIYLRQGTVIALDCVNATRDYVQGRRLVADRLAPDPARLADPNFPLKELS